MRFRLRTLLILLAVALAGCGRTGRKIKTVRQGAEAVDKHAKKIEGAADANNLSSDQESFMEQVKRFAESKGPVNPPKGGP